MWLLGVPVALALAVLAHAAVSRVERLPGNMVFKFVAPAGLIGLGLAGGLLWRLGIQLPVLAALLAYAFGCELYIFLFTLVSSSVTVSMLLRLRGAGLTRSQIDRLYADEDMVAGRLSTLVANGLLMRTQSGYALTHRGRSVLRTFAVLRRFFGHDRVEAES